MTFLSQENTNFLRQEILGPYKKFPEAGKPPGNPNIPDGFPVTGMQRNPVTGFWNFPVNFPDAGNSYFPVTGFVTNFLASFLSQDFFENTL